VSLVPVTTRTPPGGGVLRIGPSTQMSCRAAFMAFAASRYEEFGSSGCQSLLAISSTIGFPTAGWTVRVSTPGEVRWLIQRANQLGAS